MYKELNELLAKARKGDKKSKEGILNKVRPLIIRKIQRYYNNKNLFEDLIQEGYLVVLECIESYDDSRGVYFLGYLKTMLKFTYLNKHKQRTHLSLNIPAGEDRDDEWIDLLESHGKNQEDIILEKEGVGELRHALSKLTQRQREIVIAYYIEEISIGDIAKRLGITYRTVVNTKTRALERLRELL